MAQSTVLPTTQSCVERRLLRTAIQMQQFRSHSFLRGLALGPPQPHHCKAPRSDAPTLRELATTFGVCAIAALFRCISPHRVAGRQLSARASYYLVVILHRLRQAGVFPSRSLIGPRSAKQAPMQSLHTKSACHQQQNSCF